MGIGIVIRRPMVSGQNIVCGQGRRSIIQFYRYERSNPIILSRRKPVTFPLYVII